MNTLRRRSRDDAGRRAFGGRTLVALAAAAALILGPGAVGAFAIDSPPADAAAEVVAPVVDPAPAPPADPPAPAPAEAPDAPAPPAESAPQAFPAPPAESEAPDAEQTAPPEDEGEGAPAPLRVADPPAAAVPSGGEEEAEKVEICHATGAEGHWVMVPASKTGDVQGHAGASHQDGRDIIPPFSYDGGMFPGQNWDEEGQAIYYNDCELPPPPPPNPEVEVTVDQCVEPGGEVPSTVRIVISNLVRGFDYSLKVTGPGGFESVTPITPDDGGAEVTQPINGPGGYMATVTGTWMVDEVPVETAKGVVIDDGDTTVTGSTEFTVDECPPPEPENPVVTVTVEQCLTSDGVVPGTVSVHVSKLLEGFEYKLEVMGPDGFLATTPLVPVDGEAHVEQAIPGPGDYVAKVTGIGWIKAPPPEPDGVAFSTKMAPSEDDDWYEEIWLSAEVAFTVNACPPPPAIVPDLPITSSAPPIQALAVTGAAASDGSPLGVALLLLGAGMALLATGAHRAMRSRA